MVGDKRRKKKEERGQQKHKNANGKNIRRKFQRKVFSEKNSTFIQYVTFAESISFKMRIRCTERCPQMFFYWNVEKQIEFCFCWNPIKNVCVEVRDRACQMRRNFFKIFRLMETKVRKSQSEREREQKTEKKDRKTGEIEWACEKNNKKNEKKETEKEMKKREIWMKQW